MTLDPSEFEAGENVTHLILRSKERPGMVISVRFTADECDALFAVVGKGSIVDFVRAAALTQIEAQR